MLTYGGLGLLIGGLFLTFFADKVISDPEKAARSKKQGPILAAVGAGALGLAVVLSILIA